MQINALEYFESTVRASPQKAAVYDGTSRLTFSQLHDQAIHFALVLEGLTSKNPEPIGLLLPKSNRWIIGLLATLYAGHIYAPLDARTPSERLSTILEKLSPSAVFITEETRGLAVAAGISETQLIDISNPTSAMKGDPAGWKSRLDADPAYIIHTSGSTGAPKGVVISHKNIIDYIDWAIETYRIDGDEVIGSQAPYYFDNSTLDFYLSFATGATLILIPDQHFSFPVRLMEFMTNETISFIFWVPSIMVNIANLKLLSESPRPKLTKILFAGEVMPNRQLNQWRRAFPNALFSNLYGPTEITVDCTYLIVDRPFADDDPLPIGLPCRNTDILILSEGKLVSLPGEIGELCVRGTSLALGYWGDSTKTAEKFIQNPLNTKYPERIYCTGDLVSYNDRGEIMFHGRLDSQIKHQGFRIELGEIENACLNLQEINKACVLYRQDHKQIVLFYEASAPIPPEEIRKALGIILPKYMLPTEFHHLMAIPMNPNGKIDRNTLQLMIDDGIAK